MPNKPSNDEIDRLKKAKEAAKKAKGTGANADALNFFGALDPERLAKNAADHVKNKEETRQKEVKKEKQHKGYSNE